MVWGGSVRGDEIDVLVFLACYLHKAVCHRHLCGFLLLCGEVEIAAFPADCLLENERDIGMSGLNSLNEGEKALIDHFCIRIREGIEDIGVHIGSGEGLCEIALEF